MSPPPAAASQPRGEDPPIGIGGVAVELADLRIPSAQFSRISDIPVEVVERKLGFKQVLRWGDGPGPQAAAIRCAHRALGGLDPRELGMILTIAHPWHLEREVYGFGALLQDRLGASNAEVMDIADTCSSVTLGLQAARDLLVAEPELKHVLLTGAVTMLDMLDLSNPATTWMANLSDGAGALLVSRDPSLDNVLLETAHRCDPQFIDDVLTSSPYLPEPISYKERFRRFLPWRIDVVDKESMKARLDPVSLPSYIEAIRASLHASGFRDDEVDLVGANTMKTSMWRALCDAFKLRPEEQMYLEEVGHVGYIDQFLFLQKTREERRLPRGGVLVLTTAGVGFHWTATTVAFKGPRLGGRFP